jgi:hypothetical protein
MRGAGKMLHQGNGNGVTVDAQRSCRHRGVFLGLGVATLAVARVVRKLPTPPVMRRMGTRRRRNIGYVSNTNSMSGGRPSDA